MFGDMYSQMMKARLGVGKPMEGYGMSPQMTLPQQPQPQNGGVVPPWMQGGMWRQQQPHEPRPQGGGYLPMENPWNPRQTDFEPRPQGGESPWNPRQTGYEPKPKGGPMGAPIANPWLGVQASVQPTQMYGGAGRPQQEKQMQDSQHGFMSQFGYGY